MTKLSLILLTTFFLSNIACAQISGGLPPLHTPAYSPTPAAAVPVAPIPDKLVRSIQEMLNEKGFDVGVTDGFMGPQTQNAIIAAERTMGLTVTGIPSDRFLSEIKSFKPVTRSQSSVQNAIQRRAVIGTVRSVYRDLNYAEVLIFASTSVFTGQTLFIGPTGQEFSVSRVAANLASIVSIRGSTLAQINNGDTVEIEIK
jgi:peptidoglycan hydrolase-like protein with peptidoglycan-binding domain